MFSHTPGADDRFLAMRLSSTETAFIGATSMTMPSAEERPPKQCPPLRVAVGSPVLCANEIVSVSS